MWSISRRLALLIALSVFALAQNPINLDTGVKGSRLPMWGVDSGSANAYVLTTSAVLGPTLRTGSHFVFVAAHTNTTSSTANVDSTGAITIKKFSAGTLSNLAAGDITALQVVIIWYDGTQYQCVTCGSSVSGTVTSVTCGTGLSGGTITSSGTCALANTAVTPGSYTNTNLTVDAQGRLTAASNGTGGSGCALSNGTSLKTANYPLVSGDAGFLMIFNGTSLTATLPSPPPTASWCVSIWNQNVSPLTVSRNGLLINTGSSDITLQQYQSTTCWNDTTNYVCTRPAVAGSNVAITQNTNSESIAATVNGVGGAPGVVLCDTGTITDTVSNAAGDFSHNCTFAANGASYGTEYLWYAEGVETIVSGDNHQFGTVLDSSTLDTPVGHSSFTGTFSWSLKSLVTIGAVGASGFSLPASSSVVSYVWQQNNGSSPGSIAALGATQVVVAWDTTVSHTLKIHLGGTVQSGSTATLKRLVVIQIN